ncbi:uncharacterized protein L3040_001460 [Drepanopeziza brunnea f. sp. 'multigermtubi']|uniref:GCN5-related N acetyltransferase n=1 Tax=Marssonina brunnea f. sp. multigermtubi (strain MB_m1) TaxID=1072389 RepID=K1WGP4_MARBU|nr:GCN5-related N acetyltransferase [Drepanopeziza brunnea f. sp. 'multigermtubi' MB_m1]EKD16720.1 GCN5-related N acetyltransferase [Drepanopeziza brunnea f. sp. 'multigermtubi' MB_m1]KAJ5051687.1 hypothetical protein L3040_001460 [Drepanopeziza brunnea f. sp. 'multigermtubi']
MDTSSASSPPAARIQPSIRSFFQPRQPSYTAPPGSSAPQPSPSPLPSRSTTQTPPPPPSLPSPNPANTSPQAPQALQAPKLPAQATISPISQAHIQPLRRINALLLPIAYPDSFYQKILSPDPATPGGPPSTNFSRAILWTDPASQETKLVGGVVCRLDPALSPTSTPETPVYAPDAHDIYVQSLALLSPYRGKGLVAAVLSEIIEAATRQTEAKIRSLYAHVWTQNEEALAWYAARGFTREEGVIHGYYRRLSPDTALIYRRPLRPSDHLNAASAVQTSRSVSDAQVSSPTTAKRPALPAHARSFQDKGPEREWNDLPEDILGGGMLKPPSALGSQQGSAASSRSSSRGGAEGRGKKKRAYPAAAFGS